MRCTERSEMPLTAAVDLEHLSGDVAAAIRGEEQHRLGDLVGRPHPLQRRLFDRRPHVFGRDVPIGLPVGGDRAGRHGVDADLRGEVTRQRRGETAETRFVSIDGATVTAAELRARTAQLTIRFVSKLITATRDRSGAVIEGNAEKVTDVTDVWTFAREVSSRDPNWKVIATEAGQ